MLPLDLWFNCVSYILPESTSGSIEELAKQTYQIRHSKLRALRKKSEMVYYGQLLENLMNVMLPQIK